MVIKLFEIGQEQEISEMINRSISKLNSDDYSSKILCAVRNLYTPEKIIEYKTNRDIYVYIKSEKIIGTVSLEHNRVYSLFINPDFVKKGVGKNLMFRLESDAITNNIDRICLNSTLTAVEFYKKLGYEKIHEIPNKVYGTNIFMQKQLGNEV